MSTQAGCRDTCYPGAVAMGVVSYPPGHAFDCPNHPGARELVVRTKIEEQRAADEASLRQQVHTALLSTDLSSLHLSSREWRIIEGCLDYLDSKAANER